MPSFETAARSVMVTPTAAPFITAPKLNSSLPRLGANREAASSSCRMVLLRSIAHQLSGSG
jgi:hypothetical protein